ncbi:MAG: exonuclease domain-containing protein [Aquiluna sp.]
MLDFDFEPEAPEWAKQLAVFDLETTGLDVKTSRIVTACVAVINQNGEVTDLGEWLVDPGIDIPEQASNVHGVTTEIAQRDGQDSALAVGEISRRLAELSQLMPLVAFNAAYDFSILHHESLRVGIEPLDPKPVIDPLVIDRKVDKWRKGKRNLTMMCDLYGIRLTDAHNSTADAVAAGQIAQRLAAQYSELDLPAMELHNLQSEWADEWSREREAYFKRENRPDFRAEFGWPVRLS